jgi:uncharacterized protein involved in exopolysaccharide biosynthesis
MAISKEAEIGEAMRFVGSIDADSTTNEIDLSKIGRVLYAKRWWVIGPTLAALIGALIFVFSVTPRYSADARVLLENQENFLTRGADRTERADPSAVDAEAVQSQIQLLTSRDLARRVIKKLGLKGNSEFDPVAGGIGPLERLLVLLGIMRDPTGVSPEERILDKFSERLGVLSPTKTRVLSIEFSSRDPDLAARAANAIAETYIEMQQEAKRENARAAAQSLATLVADLHNRVAEADSRVEEFRAKAGLLIGANNAAIPTQQLGELNQQLSNARAAQADAQAKARLLREMIKQNRVGEIPDVANNEVIRRIYEQRVSLRAQLALESRTLLPMHPRIKELTAQLNDLDAQWRVAAERTARTLENDARIAAARVENLRRALDEQKEITGAAGAEEVKLRDLERVARLLKDQLEAETAKYQEALARERVKATPADARIIQRALAPQRPSFPKKLQIVAFSTIAALILSVGAIISGELLTGRAQLAPALSEAPLQRFETGAPLAQETKKPEPVEEESRAANEPLAAETDASPPAASADAEAGKDAFSLFDNARNAMTCVRTLVAPCEDEGDSSNTVIALGRNLAQRGRALLIVADRKAKAYDALLGERDGPPKGFGDLLAGEAAFEDVIHRDIGSRMHLMLGGTREAAEQTDIATVVEALAHAYDFVVLAASRETAGRFAPFADLAFVIGGESDAEALREELAQAGADTYLLRGGASADDLVAA